MNSGVYVIENIISSKVYVGSSARLTARLSQHRSDLRAGRHANIHLQNSWNKWTLGEIHLDGTFQFRVIELCSPDILKDREQYWLDRITSEKYNILEAAYVQSGWSHTEEAKLKISKTSFDMWRKRRNDLVASMSESNQDPKRNDRRSATLTKKRSGKYQGMVLIKNDQRIVINKSLKRFAKEYNLHYSTLWNVLNGRMLHVKGWRLQ